MTDYCSKKSGQLRLKIPVFGDWDSAGQLPITQYFASATEAGLIRYSSTSGECAPTVGRRESYGANPSKQGPTNSHQTKRPQGKAFYSAEPPLKGYNNHSQPHKPPKPVDEDLYEVPPDHLKHESSKRNKMLRVLSRCLIPACDS